MNRRSLLLLGSAGILGAALQAKAQQAMPRIGFLGAASATGFARHIAGLRAGLREAGYVENKNILIEFRWAEGKLDRLPALAAELVRLKVDVLVTQGTPATLAAKTATATIPIVMAAVGDPEVTGIVSSLARPGGNITGMSFFSSEVAAKRLELLKDAVPQVKRVGLPFNPDNPIQRAPLHNAVLPAAARLNLTLHMVEARSPQDFEGALSKMVVSRVDAVMFIEDPTQIANAKMLVDLAIKKKLIPVGSVEFALTGSVIGFGVNFPDLYRRAAFIVDKVLKGAKPADLPIERATRFELIVNVKSATALGLEIPKSVLFRADRIIE